jgi:hypothetical protein
VIDEGWNCSVVDLVLERGSRTISNATGLSNPTPVMQVHVAHEQYPMAPSAALSPNNRGKLCDKLQRLGAEPSVDDALQSDTGNERCG